MDSTFCMIRRGFLDRQSRHDLIELARDGSAAHQLARRANALVLLDGGMSCSQVARVLFLDDDTIRTWHRLYLEDGIEGLVFVLRLERSHRYTPLDYAEIQSGRWIEGIYRRPIDLASGCFAVIEKSREFALVPWRPVLERSLGKQVSGIARGETISWTIGRGAAGRRFRRYGRSSVSDVEWDHEETGSNHRFEGIGRRRKGARGDCAVPVRINGAR